MKPGGRVRCPICQKPVDENELGRPGSTFPFCSDRCRLIDLGRWLSGKYQISTTPDEGDQRESNRRRDEPDERR